MNLVVLTGTICDKVIELKKLNNIVYAKFLLLVSLETSTKPQFINCIAFGEVSNYVIRTCQRGSFIEVIGELRSVEEYDKETNEKKHINRVRVNQLRCLNKPSTKTLLSLDDFLELYSPDRIKARTEAYNKIIEENKKIEKELDELESAKENLGKRKGI